MVWNSKSPSPFYAAHCVLKHVIYNSGGFISYLCRGCGQLVVRNWGHTHSPVHASSLWIPRSMIELSKASYGHLMPFPFKSFGYVFLSLNWSESLSHPHEMLNTCPWLFMTNIPGIVVVVQGQLLDLIKKSPKSASI